MNLKYNFQIVSAFLSFWLSIILEKIRDGIFFSFENYGILLLMCPDLFRVCI